MVIETRRDRQKNERRDVIIDAALTLFRERGFENTTVADITSRADVAKGTFFNYFERKQSVLEHDYRRLASEFLRLAREPRRAATTRRRLRRFFEEVEARLRDEGPLLEVLFREVFAQPELIRLDAATELEIAEVYRQMLRAGIERGELRRFDVDVAVKTIIDLWSATLRSWIDRRRGFSLARQLNAKLDLLFRGLHGEEQTAPKKRKRS